MEKECKNAWMMDIYQQQATRQANREGGEEGGEDEGRGWCARGHFFEI